MWATEINKVKERRKILNRVHRLAALRTIRAYRTVSLDAATILAGIPPFDIIAMNYFDVYNEIEEIKSEGRMVTLMERNEIRSRIMERTTLQWIRRMRRDANEGGSKIRAAISPIMQDWLDREEGELTFEVTQMLTGHGVFKKYLWRINKIENPGCCFCNAAYQDNIHLLAVCPKWREERLMLRAGLCVASDVALNLEIVCKKIIENIRK